jgi:hypothetical protein
MLTPAMSSATPSMSRGTTATEHSYGEREDGPSHSHCLVRFVRLSAPLQSLVLFGVLFVVAIIGGAGNLLSLADCHGVPVFQPATGFVLAVLFVVHGSLLCRHKVLDILIAGVASALGTWIWHPISYVPLSALIIDSIAAFLGGWVGMNR